MKNHPRIIAKNRISRILISNLSVSNRRRREEENKRKTYDFRIWRVDRMLTISQYPTK